MDNAARTHPLVQMLKPLGKQLLVVFVAFMGMAIFAMIGSLAYPDQGIGAMAGGAFGFFSFFTLTCLGTGLIWDMIPSKLTDGTSMLNAGNLLPHSLAVQLGSHGPFTLILSIHEAVDVRIMTPLPWKDHHMYIEVSVGNNPIKCTCVKKEVDSRVQYNEQFKLNIEPGDKNIMVKLKHQDLFGCTDIGHILIDIHADIICDHFPLHKHFTILAGEGDRLRQRHPPAYLDMSFDHTPDFKPHEESDTKKLQKKMDTCKAIESKWQLPSYGSVAHLSHLQFNTQVSMPAPETKGQKLGP